MLTTASGLTSHCKVYPLNKQKEKPGIWKIEEEPADGLTAQGR